MASEATSMIGHTYNAVQRAGRAVFLNPVVRFIGRTVSEMGERLIPHGASEIGQVIYGAGSAFSPPGMTERPANDQGNVHGTGAGQAPVVSQPVQQSAQPTKQSDVQRPLTGNLYYPQAEPDSRPSHNDLYFTATSDYSASLDARAARLPNKSEGQDHVR